MAQNLAIGIQITIIGMGLVFLLLALLWGLMTLALRLDRRRANPRDAALQSKGSATLTGAEQMSPEAVAAVMVAVRLHRRIRRKQAAPAMRSHRPGTLLSRWVGAGRTGQNQNWQPRRR